MVNYLTQSEHWIGGDEMEKEKAWHILSILFSTGTPLRAAELAYRCRLFDVSVEFIEFLCSISESPLYLTEDRFVSISSVAFSVITEFVRKAVGRFVPRIAVRVSEPKGLWNGVIRTNDRKRKDDGEVSFVLPSAKRRLILGPEDEGNGCVLAVEEQVGIIRNTNLLMEGGMSVINHEPKVSSPETSIEIPDTYGTSPTDCVKDGNQGEEKVVIPEKLQDSVDIQQHQCSYLSTEIVSNFLKAVSFVSGYEQKFLTKIVDISEVQNNDNKICVAKRGSTTTCQETENRDEGLPVSVTYDDFVSKTIANVIAEAKVQYRCEGGEDKINLSPANGNLKLLVQTDTVQGSLENDLGPVNETCYDDKAKPSNKEKLNSKMEIQGHFPSVQPNKAKMPSGKASLKVKSMQNLLTVGPKVTTKVFDYNVANDSKQEKCKRDQKSILVQEKLKNDLTANKESKANATSTDPKNNLEAKALPDFESFIVEEEEGSGGYGTVYRAQRKTDGKTFAIKCPHANAHIHHVNNELKMLEQFGGQNFVIKFEGSFKSSDAECFVLEHVEHDRPEVLKREIDVFQLQWYGYCMFRALASLHKQGIVHRDVKPGNFLFSRKLNKGYLIDFNLAMDLHKKYGTTSKSKTYSMSLNRVPLPCSVSNPPIKGRKTMGGTVLESGHRETKKDIKLPHEPKNAKKRADVIHLKPYTDLGTRSILKSQGADGSGITSTKEGTSGRTPSAERLREPRPYSSRKELNRLVQEAMGNTDHKAVRSLPTQRKRVAASPGKMDRKFYLTPMPVNSNGAAVSGSGLWKNKGDGKHKREGPCVGTKGFRAPEVLFKSPHQGCKVDVWSAGVTLLYLMIGRTPFTGDPEQNVKDIAKLRGSEDLWEVAKLHNRETSFPMELFDIQSLPSMSIRDWCEMNTKRPEFVDMMPNSLFDLIEKCLTVNPRCRISADEALGHEFFTRCHEDLRRKRLMRKTLSIDSATSLLSEGQLKAEVKV